MGTAVHIMLLCLFVVIKGPGSIGVSKERGEEVLGCFYGSVRAIGNLGNLGNFGSVLGFQGDRWALEAPEGCGRSRR